jgi:hypothetical protein
MMPPGQTDEPASTPTGNAMAASVRRAMDLMDRLQFIFSLSSVMAGSDSAVSSNRHQLLSDSSPLLQPPLVSDCGHAPMQT